VCLTITLVTLIAAADDARAKIGDSIADSVLGQAAFDDEVQHALGAATFAQPSGIAVDRSVTPNRIYVADSVYHRVLGWSDVDAMTDGAPADIVIGQPNFEAWGCNRVAATFGITPPATASTLCDPNGLAVDGSGNLYVADTSNSRVAIFLDPFGSDQVADTIIGDLYLVRGVAVDAAGNVFTAQSYQCRVQEYDAPLSGDLVADRIFSSSCTQVYVAMSVAVDAAGNLYLGSRQYVHIWRDALASDTVMDRTLGSADPSTCNTNDGQMSASTFCGPHGVAVNDMGRLFVADVGNSRVLEFDTPLTVSQAARGFGQPALSGTNTIWTDLCNTGGPSSSSLCMRRQRDDGPGYVESGAVAVDDGGRLYVADGLNHRVLRYDAPTTTDAVADLVLGQIDMTRVQQPVIPVPEPYVAADNRRYNHIVVDTANSRILVYSRLSQMPLFVVGQPNFTSTSCNSGGISSASLCRPTAAVIDDQAGLWVADTGNNRVLHYEFPWAAPPTAATWTTASRVFGQPSFATNACGSGPSGLCAPQGVAVTGDYTLYISDSNNNRVLYHANPLAEATADAVYGQPDLTARGCNTGGTGAASLCDPRGIAFEESGNLYVADSANNRVVVYEGFDSAADRFYGQTSANSSSCAAGRGGLCGPVGGGFDKGGNLFSADTLNNRVLEYDAPSSSDTMANRVFGQPDFTAVGCNTGGISAESLCAPTAVAGTLVDATLLVADQGNQRVLRFNAPFCIGDFQLTPETRTLSGWRSSPKTMGARIALGPDTADDVLEVKGRLELLEADGGIDVIGDEALLVLATPERTVFEQTLPYLASTRVTENGGLYEADEYGIVDAGIEYFRVKTSFVIPAGDDKPQRDRISFDGHAIGLDLASFDDEAASLRLQFAEKCFTTELRCRSGSGGVKCRPAR
jgi:sugar lactone lactonase YvrE